NFWDERLEWFELQAKEGLLGEIDWDETRNGTIVCKDGFRATTVSPADFTLLAADLHVQAAIEEVDNSSIFCTITASHS
ncbi:MAG: class I SAM-dependent methyltransferase, partial [Candidatus Hodarchaeales archaeon]